MRVRPSLKEIVKMQGLSSPIPAGWGVNLLACGIVEYDLFNGLIGS